MWEKIPTFAGCHLATHPKSWFCGRRGIGLQVIFLLFLETSQYPSSCRPEEVALFVCLDGKYPSSCHIILQCELHHFYEVKKPHCKSRISTQGVSLQQTACSIFVLLGRTLLFVPEFCSWLLLLPLFQRWLYSNPACLWFDCQFRLEFKPCAAGIVGHFIKAQ